MLHASAYDTYLQVADVKVGDDPAEFYQLMKGLCTICRYLFTSHDSGQDQTGRYYWGIQQLVSTRGGLFRPQIQNFLSPSCEVPIFGEWKGGIIPDTQYYT